MAEFTTAEALARAVGEAREAGCTPLDTLTPFPVPEVERALAPAADGMALAGLIGGLALGALTYALQAYANAIAYPIDVGGRPLHSWPAFLPASIAIGLLGAAIGVFVRMLMCCRLPRLHHPLFELGAVERASTDRFFLVLPGGVAEALVARLEPHAVHTLEADP